MIVKGWLGILVIVLVFGTIVIGCDIPDEDTIIGVWEEYPVGTSLNFKADNTVIIKLVNWSERTYSYELNDKTLILTFNNEDSYTGNIQFDYSNKETKLVISGFSASPSSAVYYINRTYFKK